jgi:hypothetical protein
MSNSHYGMYGLPSPTQMYYIKHSIRISTELYTILSRPRIHGWIWLTTHVAKSHERLLNTIINQYSTTKNAKHTVQSISSRMSHNNIHVILFCLLVLTAVNNYPRRTHITLVLM